jgi:hypothetical protein
MEIHYDTLLDDEENTGSAWVKMMKPIKKKLIELETKLRNCDVNEYVKLSREYSQLQFKLEFLENMSVRYTRDKLKTSSEMRHLTQLQLNRLRIKN